VSSAAEAAPLVGIRVGRVLMVGWALAAAIGALAGGLVAHSIGVDPDNMVRLLIFALAAAALGGLDSPGGALVGGFAFGIGEALLMGYVPFISSDVAIIWALGALVVVLMLRPRGLFGRVDSAIQR
jgi:branched-chain amino acid transport system permease protein